MILVSVLSNRLGLSIDRWMRFVSVVIWQDMSLNPMVKSDPDVIDNRRVAHTHNALWEGSIRIAYTILVGEVHENLDFNHCF